jgi:predicted ester cyclase
LERFETVHRYHGVDFVVDESVVHATAIGSPFGIPGKGRGLSFRLLHIFDVRDGLIRRENAWLDMASIMAQLTA